MAKTKKGKVVNGHILLSQCDVFLGALAKALNYNYILYYVKENVVFSERKVRL